MNDDVFVLSLCKALCHRSILLTWLCENGTAGLSFGYIVQQPVAVMAASFTIWSLINYSAILALFLYLNYTFLIEIYSIIALSLNRFCTC